MKRKRNSESKDVHKAIAVLKKGKKNIEQEQEEAESVEPTVCSYALKERVIGFYGGWPYVGVVQAIEEVFMTFGTTYVLLIRWNGFSGKNATTWTSEFDVVKYNEEGLALKEEVCVFIIYVYALFQMEVSRREKLNAYGRRADIVQQRKIFNQVVKEFRGGKLSPFAPLTSPYPEEWQTIIRICAMPQALVDHLATSETLIYSRKLMLTTEITTCKEALSKWSGADSNRIEYASVMTKLLNEYLVSNLLYKFELQFVTKYIATMDDKTDYSTVFSLEYLVRLLALLPQLLTASHQGVLFKGVAQVKPLFTFCEQNQSFMKFIENNIETFLRRAIRMSTLEEPVPETFWMNAFHKSKEDEAPQKKVEGDSIIEDKQTFCPSKWKRRVPTHRPPRRCL